MNKIKRKYSENLDFFVFFASIMLDSLYFKRHLSENLEDQRSL